MDIKNNRSTRTKRIKPNKQGLPCYTKKSNDLSADHEQWRKAQTGRKSRQLNRLFYWKRVSECPSL